MRWASGLWLLSGLAAGAGAIAATPLGLALALGPGAVGGLALWRRWPRLGAGAFAWTLGLAAAVIPGLGGRPLWLHARRALALAGGGMGLAASWWALTVALPFRWLLALVGLAWLAVWGLIWLAGRSHPSGGVASGNRSSSSPSE